MDCFSEMFNLQTTDIRCQHPFPIYFICERRLTCWRSFDQQFPLNSGVVLGRIEPPRIEKIFHLLIEFEAQESICETSGVFLETVTCCTRRRTACWAIAALSQPPCRGTSLNLTGQNKILETLFQQKHNTSEDSPTAKLNGLISTWVSRIVAHHNLVEIIQLNSFKLKLVNLNRTDTF